MFEGFLAETGYDSSKYTTGFDLSLKDPDTLALMDYIIELLTEGVSKSFIENRLYNEMGIKYMNAKALLGKCHKRLNEELDADVVKTLNAKRLQHAYNQAMQNQKYGDAVKAIAELNKLFGFNIEKVELGGEGEFTFKLGGIK